MKNKKWLLIAASLLLVFAIVMTVVLIGIGNREPVGVYPFTMVGMDGYWGDTQESHGPVSTDKIQTVFLTDTQTVTQVLVAQGDTVKKGDVLMHFDTSLSDLQLERKRLEVEKLKLQVTEAREELRKIRNMKPMQAPTELPDLSLPAANPGSPIPSAWVYQKNVVSGHDGLTADTAFICWLRSDTPINDDLLNDMRLFLWDYHKQPALCEHGNLPDSCAICNPVKCVHNNVESLCPVCSPVICSHNNIQQFCEVCNPCPHGREPSDCEVCRPPLCALHGYIERHCPLCHPPQCIHGAGCQICNPPSSGGDGSGGSGEGSGSGSGEGSGGGSGEGSGNGSGEGSGGGEGTPQGQGTETQPAEGQPTAAVPGSYRVRFLSSSTAPASTDMEFHVVFKTTVGDTDLAMTNLWQGMKVTYKDGRFSQQFYVPAIADYTQPVMDDTGVSVIPDIDIGSGFTAAQIAQMRSDQELKIKELELKHKMANAEYKIMQKEMGDGSIYAEFDGKVVSLLSQEESKKQKQPVVKVSGGGGFFIQGSVSELEKDNLSLDQQVTVNDWANGGVYTGTVRSIGDFPSSDGYWNGMGNPNTTYYPFTVFVGEEASLQAGSYANIQYSTSEAASGLYLDKTFLRTEDGRDYVFLRGADNLLEKRFVTTGKTLWGSYVEIKAGITVEDYIAFPYGKQVKPGAPTRESDLSELYSY